MAAGAAVDGCTFLDLSAVLMSSLPISATLFGSSLGESDGGGAGAMYIFMAAAGKAGGPIDGGGGAGGWM